MGMSLGSHRTPNIFHVIDCAANKIMELIRQRANNTVNVTNIGFIRKERGGQITLKIGYYLAVIE